MAEATQPVRGHLMITHTHWDHVQGFPFFAPMFSAGSEWDLYVPDDLGECLEAVLSAPFVRARVGVWLERVGGESS